MLGLNLNGAGMAGGCFPFANRLRPGKSRSSWDAFVNLGGDRSQVVDGLMVTRSVVSL